MLGEQRGDGLLLAVEEDLASLLLLEALAALALLSLLAFPQACGGELVAEGGT